MLLKRKYVFQTENKFESEKILRSKCKFVNRLIGIYFFIYDNDKWLFDAKYIDEKMYMYYRDNRRTFFNPLIIVEFSEKNICIKIKYNVINFITIIGFSLLFSCVGIIGWTNGYSLLGYLPLISFWIIVILSFNIYSKKILKVFSSMFS